MARITIREKRLDEMFQAISPRLPNANRLSDDVVLLADAQVLLVPRKVSLHKYHQRKNQVYTHTNKPILSILYQDTDEFFRRSEFAKNKESLAHYDSEVLLKTHLMHPIERELIENAGAVQYIRPETEFLLTYEFSPFHFDYGHLFEGFIPENRDSTQYFYWTTRTIEDETLQYDPLTKRLAGKERLPVLYGQKFKNVFDKAHAPQPKKSEQMLLEGFEQKPQWCYH